MRHAGTTWPATWHDLTCTLGLYGSCLLQLEALPRARLPCKALRSRPTSCLRPLPPSHEQGHWGAFGGNQTSADVGSGIGAIHNTLMLDHTEKAVVRTPFVSALHPQPERYAPVPLPVAKLVAGAMHGGLWGGLKLMLGRGAA